MGTYDLGWKLLRPLAKAINWHRSVAVIRCQIALAEVQQSWAGVEALRSRLQVSAFASVGFLGGTFPFTLSNAAHNLPFIHAYSVLSDVLKQLAIEGHFNCKSIFLGKLLPKSQNALVWHDFALVHAGYGRRNDVAHYGELLKRDECWKYVDAVKAELLGWRIL